MRCPIFRFGADLLVEAAATDWLARPISAQRRYPRCGPGASGVETSLTKAVAPVLGPSSRSRLATSRIIPHTSPLGQERPYVGVVMKAAAPLGSGRQQPCHCCPKFPVCSVAARLFVLVAVYPWLFSFFEVHLPVTGSGSSSSVIGIVVAEALTPLDPLENLTGCVWVNFTEVDGEESREWNGSTPNGSNLSSLTSRTAWGNGTWNSSDSSQGGGTRRLTEEEVDILGISEGMAILHPPIGVETRRLSMVGAGAGPLIPEEADHVEEGGYWINCTHSLWEGGALRGALEDEILRNVSNATNTTLRQNATADGTDVTFRFVLSFVQTTNSGGDGASYPSTVVHWAQGKLHFLSQALADVLGIAASATEANGGLYSHVYSTHVRALDDTEWDEEGLPASSRILRGDVGPHPGAWAPPSGAHGGEDGRRQEEKESRPLSELPRRRFRRSDGRRLPAFTRSLADATSRALVTAKVRLGEDDLPAAMASSALAAASSSDDAAPVGARSGQGASPLNLDLLLRTLEALLQAGSEPIPAGLALSAPSGKDLLMRNVTPVTEKAPAGSQETPAPAPPPTAKPDDAAKDAASEGGAGQSDTGGVPADVDKDTQSDYELKQSTGPATLEADAESGLGKVEIGLICSGVGIVLVGVLVLVMMKGGGKSMDKQMKEDKKKRLARKATSYSKTDVVPEEVAEQQEHEANEPEEEKAGAGEQTEGTPGEKPQSDGEKVEEKKGEGEKKGDESAESKANVEMTEEEKKVEDKNDAQKKDEGKGDGD